jgi:hypothetical protein
MKNKTPYFMVFFALFVSLNSCENLFQNKLIVKMDKETFEKEYSAWESQKLKNYRFTYEFFNDAGPVGPIRITITENNPPEGENINPDGGQFSEEDIQDISGIYERIRSTFEFIERVKNGNYDGPKINLLVLDIKYDAQYHYPREVNFSEGYEEAVDGGGYYTLKIKDFETEI